MLRVQCAPSNIPVPSGCQNLPPIQMPLKSASPTIDFLKNHNRLILKENIILDDAN
jgi:hypothetical protein